MTPIWIGFFTITGPREHSWLEGNAGACLWIAAQAEDSEKLQLRATNVMQHIGLTVIEAEDMKEVIHEDNLEEEVAKLIPEARRNVESVVCGTLHRFKNHDA